MLFWKPSKAVRRHAQTGRASAAVWQRCSRSLLKGKEHPGNVHASVFVEFETSAQLNAERTPRSNITIRKYQMKR